MSGYLWKAYLEDDVASFRAVLESAHISYKSGTIHKGSQHAQLSVGSYENHKYLDDLATTPRSALKLQSGNQQASISLTRSDLNRSDGQGRTLLHLAASSKSDSASEFAQALLDQPQTDIYVQDSESGWTALHRAFYAGKLSIALAILTRDMQDAYGATTVNLNHPGGLIRIKDHEGNGPFDVLEQTYEAELRTPQLAELYDGADSEDSDDDTGHGHYNIPAVRGTATVLGNEVFSFGSNKNLNLGFGDEDDRAYPERITLSRPLRLIKHFWQIKTGAESSFSPSQIPFLERCKPIMVRDVQIGKYSSAIITDDPFGNLHMCGHGSNGRLGLGDERTRFHFTCVDGGASADEEIVAVSLGNHHTLALSKSGAVFSWGSNMFGQLGYALSKTSKNDEPTQSLPRQIYNPIKKEFVCGIAASASHSALYTRTDLYTFGKNDGQLGVVDADARALSIINTPRKVGGNKFNSAIDSVTAIDNATICLLANREVWVYANYGYTKLVFPTTFLPNHFLRTTFVTHGAQSLGTEQRICKIASGGDTIAALSSTGTIYTLSVARPTLSAQDASSSTTNPAKIRSALSYPSIVWSNRKTRLAATDVAVDQNGSIILSTQAGSVWRRVKRAKIKDTSAASALTDKAKDYKFSRISGLTSVSAVRASGYGAYAAVRKEPQAGIAELELPSKTLRRDLLAISPFTSDKIIPESSLIAQLVAELPQQSNMEAILMQMFATYSTHARRSAYIMLCTKHRDVKVPTHQFLLAACSPVLRENLKTPSQSLLPNVYQIEMVDGQINIIFKELDLLSLTNLVLYIHCGQVMLASRLACKVYQQWSKGNKQVLLQASSQLQIRGFVDTIRTGSAKNGSYRNALENFFHDMPTEAALLPGRDAQVDLADGSREVHSALVCQRSEFFKALFQGGVGGRWLDGRNEEDDLVRVDLKHVGTWAFDKFLQWAYSDKDLDLLGDIVADDLEEYVDKVVEILGLANELMVRPLSEICQAVLAQHITARNVCQILVAVAPAHVENLKQICLQYVFLNLEAVVRHGRLDELDDDLLLELDDVAQSIQQSRSIISRSGQLEEELLQRHPELSDKMAAERQAKIDSIMILNKYLDVATKGPSSYRAGSFHDEFEMPLSLPKSRRRSSNNEQLKNEAISISNGKETATDFIFDMDGEEAGSALIEPPKQTSKAISLERETATETDWTMVGSLRGSTRTRSDPANQAIQTAKGEQTPKNPQLSPPLGKMHEAAPWAPQESLPVVKLAMRDIMNQAANQRTSNLSSGLSRLSPSTYNSSMSNNSRLSQKERKKIQRQGHQPLTPEAPMQASSSPSLNSPWKAIPRSKSPMNLAQPPAQPASPSTPHLTMRQTVANPASIKSLNTPTKQSTPQANTSAFRSISTPNINTPAQTTISARATPTKPSATRSDSAPHGSASPATPLQPRSIRHTPRPVRDVSLPQHISMSEILHQQQFDKLVAAGGGEKRSLSDIQTEQEFQEWWDKESARVQDEASSSSKTKRGGKQGGRHGRSRGAGSDKQNDGGSGNAGRGKSAQSSRGGKAESQGRQAQE